MIYMFRRESTMDQDYLTMLPTTGDLSMDSDNDQQPTELLLRKNKGGAQMKRT